jgi:flavin-dependent dehydrogenase
MSGAAPYPVQLDIVVVGASVTGSAVATLARERGLSVVLVEARPLSVVGAPRHPTPLPIWALEESRLPVGEVIRVPSRIHLVAGDARVTLPTPDCVMLDRGALVAALLERAIALGATVMAEARVIGLAPHGDGVVLEDGTTIHAKFVIDASGADGAALLGERVLAPEDIASVAHETRRIADRRLADAYLEAASVERDEGVAFLAPCGPGSLVIARVDEDARMLAFDAVTFTDGGDKTRPTARAAIRRVARGFSWLGEILAEDTRHVPVGGLRGTLSAGNVALAGAAAGITRPGLGGECAVGMVSARMLVDGLVDDGDLSRYERRVRARFEDIERTDATLARWFRALDDEDFAALLRSGAIGEALVASILEQRNAWLAELRFSSAAAMRIGRSAIIRAFDPAPALHALASTIQGMPLLARLGGRG